MPNKKAISDNDPCGRCGCMRKHHNPPKSETSVHGYSWGPAHQVIITARTCCATCPHCFCFCTAFVEPYKGQPFTRCLYETKNHAHEPHNEWSTIPYPVSISRMVSQVQPRILDNRGVSGISSRKIVPPKKGIRKNKTDNLF
jgi:hypothetical protein